MSLSANFTTGEIADALEVVLHGDRNIAITKIASVDAATPGSITFVTGKKYLPLLLSTCASAVILPESLLALDTQANQIVNQKAPIARLVSTDPYLSYARLTRLWVAHTNPAVVSVHASASIHPTVDVGANVSVGANAVIEQGVVLEAGVTIGAGAYIGQFTRVGSNTTVHPNATVLHGCVLGNTCEVHSGAVIGADGFGWAPDADGWEKIHQLGGVRIGDRVSIGACTTIDRGALEDTVIQDGVILDNHIQVAHNVVIGRNTAIAGCTGIAGSTRIGRNCRIGGAVSIVGHIDICDKVMITANSFVNRSVKEPGSYSSGFPLERSSQWRKNALRLQKLDEFVRSVQKTWKK